MDAEHPPTPEPSGDLLPPPRDPPTALAAATPPPPPLPRAVRTPPRSLAARMREAIDGALDALDAAGDRIAQAFGAR